MAAHEHHHADRPHHHGHVHIDEADWQAWAEHTELQGEVLLGFVTETALWASELRGADAPPVGHVLDIGSGPGVGTCELARLFPDAHVTAIDGSAAMLERARHRAAALNVDARVRTHLAELPDGLDGLEPADLIWASMSLHHIGDEVASLQLLRNLLNPQGLIAIAEFGDPTRMLPEHLDVGPPGLTARLEEVAAAWFAEMRAGLSGSVPSVDLASMLAVAGFEVIGSRLARQRLDAPLGDDARRVVLRHLRRSSDQSADRLAPDDLAAIDVLTDANDSRSVIHRADVFVDASQQIVIARPLT